MGRGIKRAFRKMRCADQILRVVLWWQGLYYGLTGMWAIAGLGHFSRVTGHYGDPFEMYSIAGLAVVLGAAFIWGAMRPSLRVFAGWLLFGSAVAVIIPELAYLSEIRRTLFFLDLFEEIAIAALALFGLWHVRYSRDSSFRRESIIETESS